MPKSERGKARLPPGVPQAAGGPDAVQRHRHAFNEIHLQLGVFKPTAALVLSDALVEVQRNRSNFDNRLTGYLLLPLLRPEPQPRRRNFINVIMCYFLLNFFDLCAVWPI